MKITASFTRDRETKGTFVYKEDGTDIKIGTLYIKKPAAEQLGNPFAITVTVES